MKAMVEKVSFAPVEFQASGTPILENIQISLQNTDHDDRDR